MSRTKGSSGARTKKEIFKAGRELIYRHGYEAVSLRQLAQAVGLQQGSLYNHIKSKQELLFLLMHEHLATLVAGVDKALADAVGPVPRIKAFVAFHLTYHMQRRSEVYINNSELRSLEPGNRRKVMALRESYEGRLIDILKAGAGVGIFKVGDTRVTAFALIAMLTGICAWYSPKGALSQEDLISQHARLVLNGILG